MTVERILLLKRPVSRIRIIKPSKGVNLGEGKGSKKVISISETVVRNREEWKESRRYEWRRTCGSPQPAMRNDAVRIWFGFRNPAKAIMLRNSVPDRIAWFLTEFICNCEQEPAWMSAAHARSGVPAMGSVPEEILYDRMKTFWTGTDERGEVIWNAVFWTSPAIGDSRAPAVPPLPGADERQGGIGREICTSERY